MTRAQVIGTAIRKAFHHHRRPSASRCTGSDKTGLPCNFARSVTDPQAAAPIYCASKLRLASAIKIKDFTADCSASVSVRFSPSKRHRPVLPPATRQGWYWGRALLTASSVRKSHDSWACANAVMAVAQTTNAIRRRESIFGFQSNCKSRRIPFGMIGATTIIGSPWPCGRCICIGWPIAEIGLVWRIFGMSGHGQKGKLER